MQGQIVEVEYENDHVNIVKIDDDSLEQFVVTPLIRTSGGLFRFSKHSHVILRESIAGFYDTKELEETGLFTKIDNVYYESIETSDSDYEYESDSDTETDVSLDDE